jgi:NADP-dependent aldehyde dehydrogenase
LVGEAITNAALETGMPSGVFSLLHGKSTAVGQSLVKHPLLQAVAFTGSLRGGRALFDLAASRKSPIPCFAEMGSVNPVFLMPEQLELEAETIAAQYIDSVNLGVGQFCTNPGLVFGMQGEAMDRFIRAAAQKVRGMAAGTMLHPGIQEGYIHALGKFKESKGVQVLAEGASAHGCTGQSSLLMSAASDFIQNPAMQEEIFGPASLVIVCSDDAELLEAAAVLNGNLTAALHATASELKRNKALISVLERKVGRIIFNGFPTGVEVCHSMMHGGPYPATTDSRFTSVGSRSIERFVRPVCYQGFPQDQLPGPLRDENKSGMLRMVDGVMAPPEG